MTQEISELIEVTSTMRITPQAPGPILAGLQRGLQTGAARARIRNGDPWRNSFRSSTYDQKGGRFGSGHPFRFSTIGPGARYVSLRAGLFEQAHNAIAVFDSWPGLSAPTYR